MTVAKTKLNPAQQKAVDTIDGPVLVVAGPGTGKTQLLTARVKNICEKTDTDPASILIMTFTESGVQSVRERLRHVMGLAGYRVAVYTFHGFCQSVIEAYPEKFMFARNIRPIGDFEKIELWRELIDNAKPQRLKTFGDPYFYLSDLQSRVSELKRENIGPEDFKKHVKDWIAELDSSVRLNKKTGEPIRDWKQERDRAEKAFEMADFYSRYQSKLREKGLYDYEDMIMMVVDRFQNDFDLLADYQEKFLYIMVDEYQDTNSAQNTILQLLGSGHADGRPNIMVVGDDDQSIYRFQGASLENILFFENTFKNPEIIVLSDNYRSPQAILDMAKKVITNNKQRLDAEKKLIAINSDDTKSKSSEVAMIEFANEMEERLWIWKWISENVVSKKNCDYSDIAILLRTNNEVEEMANFLLRQDVPVVFSAGRDVLASPVTRAILDYFAVIVDPSDNEALSRVLTRQLSGIESLDVFRLIDHFHRKSIGRKFPMSMARILMDTSESDDFGPLQLTNPTAIKNWWSKIGQFKQLSAEMTLPAFFERFLQDTGFIEWVEKSENKIEGLRTLNSLFSEIKHLSSVNHSFGLKEFVHRMNVYQEYGLSLPEEPFFSPRAGVRVMTAHRAKGLEFPVVFIPRCVDKSWGNKREFSKIKLPPNLIHFQKEHDAIEDERRLFYVAVTRAKNKVIVSYARQYGSGEQIAEKQPSQFIDEASGNIFKGELQDELSVNNNLDFLEKALKPVPMADSEVDFLQTKLQDYKLSVTNLETYLNCPAQFKWAHLYQLPKAKNKYMALGTAFHFALEKFFTQFHDNQRLPDKQVLLDEYKNALEYEVLSHQEYEEMLGIGFDGLGGYFDNWQNSMTAPLAAELNFSARQVMFGDARITGKIDKIEPLDNDKSQGNKRIVFGQIVPVRVVDYKTGKVRTENEIMGKTKSADLAMFRQILFYRILTRQDYDFSRRFEMAEGQIDFVQGKDGVYKKINVPFGADDITNMEQTITDVWNKIMSLDFTPLPEKQKCEACPYRDLCQAGKLITND